MHTKRRPNNAMNGNGGGGQHRHHNNNNNNNRPRRFNNSRPNEGGGDAASISRTRRNAVQQREKYQMMARDALSMGDRVLSENYLQHADHYHRVLLSLPPEEAPRPQFQRNHQNQGDGANGEQGNGDAQQGDGQNGQDGQHNGGDHQGEQPQGGHALPSFITQNHNEPDASQE